jgi:hypothetical protein
MKEITIKLPEIEDIDFSVECHEEWEHPNNCFALDDDSQEEIVNNILTDLESGNEWAWCSVRVIGSYKGIEEDDFLGACSFKSKKDFIENSGYYDDMRNEVYQRIIERLESLSVD